MHTFETQPTHLLEVVGHAPYCADVTELPDDPFEDQYWILQSFQKGEPPLYSEHIQQGIDLLAQDPNGLLIFSGGLTRPNTHWTEAATYLTIAEQKLRKQGMEHLLGRLATEEFAHDSFENVAFGYERFKQITGHYPLQTTTIGWKFKEERFGMHAKELGIPNFEYVGANDPEGDALAAAEKGEQRTRDDYQEFPRGDRGRLLKLRQERTFSTKP